MEATKKQTLAELIKTVKSLDSTSITLLNMGAKMLKAKEQLDSEKDIPEKSA